jgi:CubicO group peptidase (beta-lactamase class C family)
MKKIIILASIILASVITYVFSDIHRIYLPTASGIMAKQMCSLHFISGFDHEQGRALYLDPLAGDFADLIYSDINQPLKEVRASIIGLYKQTAVYREGIGCSLIHDGGKFDRSLRLPQKTEFKPLHIDHTHRNTNFDVVALDSAIEANFSKSYRNTLAIAVMHKGRLVAEKYAVGISPETPLHGWSMAKSMTATLAGTMIHRGEIDLVEKGILGIPDLQEINLNHLLRMTSGLNLTENEAGWDPNSQMLFTKSDMAKWAMQQNFLQNPGEEWSYMSGNTILAMRAMQNRLGSTLKEQLYGLRERVFEPLEMHSAIIETDEAGTFQGSSYMYATAHDWARLGQLYLDNGTVGEKRIIPENWVDIVKTPTPGSGQGYGLGFWLGRSGAGAPAEGIYMSGFQGQVVYIFPKEELVIVRLGATNYADPGGYSLADDILNSMVEASSL